MTTTLGALTYTGRDATMAAFDRIEAFYGAGTNVRPECAKMRRFKDQDGNSKERVCGTTTDYVIEACSQKTVRRGMGPQRVWDIDNKGVALILNLGDSNLAGLARFLPEDENAGACEALPGKSIRGAIYIPTRVCLRCAAVADGYQDGLMGLPQRRPSHGLTVVEQESYAKTYAAAWAKASEKHRAAREAAQAKKDKKRYAETK